MRRRFAFMLTISAAFAAGYMTRTKSAVSATDLPSRSLAVPRHVTVCGTPDIPPVHISVYAHRAAGRTTKTAEPTGGAPWLVYLDDGDVILYGCTSPHP